MEALGFTQAQFYAAFLLLTRVGALFTFAPIFSHPFFNFRLRAAAVLVITAGLATMGLAGEVTPPAGTLGAALMIFRELGIGMLIGLVARIIFIAVQFGGQVLGVQMGMGVASMVDPQFGSNINPVAQLYFFASLLLFLAIGGDRMMIEAFIGNLNNLPLGQMTLSGSVIKGLIFWTGEIFSTGFRLVAPVLVGVFCSTMMLGIFARSVPQINMLILGFSLKIWVGISLMGLMLLKWIDTFYLELWRTFEVLQSFLKAV